MIRALQYIKYENIFKRQVDKSFLSQFIPSIKKKNWLIDATPVICYAVAHKYQQ